MPPISITHSFTFQLPPWSVQSGRGGKGTLEDLKMTEKNEIQGMFRYDKDSKRYHRFQVETESGVIGTIYLPKDLKPMPRKLVLEYAGKDD